MRGRGEPLRSRLRLHLGDHNAKHGSGRSIRPTQHVERKADVVGGKINRADTIGLCAAAREEIASLATIPEACRSKPPYATAAASSGKRAKDAILA